MLDRVQRSSPDDIRPAQDALQEAGPGVVLFFIPSTKDSTQGIVGAQ